MNRAVQRTGYADFWELHSRRAIPSETANYVPIILAMTIMVKNASDYGLDDIEFDPPIEYDTIQTDAQTSLALIADAADRPLSEIRELNPALLRSMAPENYEVRVPKGAGESTLAALQLVPLRARSSWRLHRVEAAESLRTIAGRYSASQRAIASANPNAPELIPGSILLIPGDGPREQPAKGKSTRKPAKRALVAANRAR